MKSITKFQKVLKLILECKNYLNFELYLEKINDKKVKGDYQEIFAKYYFLSHAKHYNIKRYYSRLTDEIPENLGVHERDVGTDAIILHNDNKISLVQVKFRKAKNIPLLRKHLSNMALESIDIVKKNRLQSLYLFANSFHSPKNIGKIEKKYIKYVMGDTLMGCNWNLIQQYIQTIKSNIAKPIIIQVSLPQKRIWQKEAKRFILGKGRNFGRKSVIAACGAGKTRIAYEIISANTKKGMKAYNKILIIVPNLHLLSQWFERMASWCPDRNYCLVGSDLNVDEAVVKNSTPFILTTNTNIIGKKISEDNIIVISTYQSLDKVLAVNSNIFDLTICDEAHKCCGIKRKTGLSFKRSNFTLPAYLDFPSNNIVYLTATPKVYTGLNQLQVMSMKDEEYFGEMYTYSFARAIKEQIISDYKIIIGHGMGTINSTEFDALFVYRSIIKYKLPNLLIFSNSHKSSAQLYRKVKELFEKKNLLGDYNLLLMKNGATSQDKAFAISQVGRGVKTIIFNVRVFGIGSDIPELHGIMLRGGRSSVIDIVQSCSRCLRRHKGKDYGKILISCLVEGEDLDSNGTFKNLRKFISSLGSVDEALVAEMVVRKKTITGDKVQIDGIYYGIDEGENINEEEAKLFLETFDVKMHDRIRESKGFSSNYRFVLLKEYCEKNNKLSPQKELYKDVKIGIFLNGLLGGKRYKNDRENWIKELKDISDEIKVELEERLNNINDPQKKKSRLITPKIRHELLKEYCEKNNKLSSANEIYKDVKIGIFLNGLLGGKQYKNNRNKWIKELKNISSELKKELEKKLKNRNDPQRKKSRLITPKVRFELLKEYCEKNNKLPFRVDINKGVNIGQFLKSLLEGKYYKNDQDNWIKELKNISFEIKEAIEKRIKNINDPQRKKSRLITPKIRFELLKEYCEKNNKLPFAKEIYKGVKIGQFLNGLLGGKKYKNDRDSWIKELKNISDEIKEELEKRTKNRNNSQKKKSRSIIPKVRFVLLKEYCKKNNKLPPQKDIYKSVKIGSFLNNLLGGKLYKNDRDIWIKELKDISSEIKEEFNKRLNTKNNIQRKKSRLITPKIRFELLKEYCKNNNKLPSWKEIYKGVIIGQFLNGLLGGKQYKNNRDNWIKELKVISSELKKELENKLKNINDPQKKKSRLITPKIRHELLKDYCEKNNKLPPQKEIYKGVKIGQFLNGLLGGKKYKNDRDSWIKELKNISDEIKEELEKRLKKNRKL